MAKDHWDEHERREKEQEAPRKTAGKHTGAHNDDNEKSPPPSPRYHLKLATADDAKRALCRMANLMLNGQIDERTGRAVIYSISVAVSAIRQREACTMKDYSKEIDELSKRLFGPTYGTAWSAIYTLLCQMHEATSGRYRKDGSEMDDDEWQVECA